MASSRSIFDCCEKSNDGLPGLEAVCAAQHTPSRDKLPEPADFTATQV
jgi:hypothetical protein